VENMGLDPKFWLGKRVFITGHTGFKGSWLSLWLKMLGSQVIGYSLAPPTNPSLFELAAVAEGITSIISDIRDHHSLHAAIATHKPEIVIHMAAQPLVRYSYEDPVGTYTTNVIGTVNLFDCIRHSKSVRAVVNVTTDKCYENLEWVWGYRENDRLGGYDPYSNSKACSELVTEAFRQSFFNPENFAQHGVAIASARAGNVIGGGDWASDRLIPDIVRAFSTNQSVSIRNPDAIRPWQHVLEPLQGYLMLAQRLYSDGVNFSAAWNFGPDDSDAKSVRWVTERLSEYWAGSQIEYHQNTPSKHEATHLKLDCSKAKTRLNWHPVWDLQKGLKETMCWYHDYYNGKNARHLCNVQLEQHMDKGG
jgi:CDP-glucose 4,6-dehydratase